MYKVIVERPRRGAGNTRTRRAPDDLEDSPRQEGLRKRHTRHKWLNENLRPLERYLASQVGRPWDKVYSEICAGIDRRDTVQRHVHQHLDGYVLTDTILDGKTVLAMNGRLGYEPISELCWLTFYVHPRTGLLCRNRQGEEKRKQLKQQRKMKFLCQLYAVDENRIRIDRSTQLHRIGGCWYRIELAPIVGHESLPDVIRHLPAARCATLPDRGKIPGNYELFGQHDVFAIRKRQLSTHELKRHGLSNTQD